MSQHRHTRKRARKRKPAGRGRTLACAECGAIGAPGNICDACFLANFEEFAAAVNGLPTWVQR